jgi:hypothetical protein
MNFRNIWSGDVFLTPLNVDLVEKIRVIFRKDGKAIRMEGQFVQVNYLGDEQGEPIIKFAKEPDQSEVRDFRKMFKCYPRRLVTQILENIRKGGWLMIVLIPVLIILVIVLITLRPLSAIF